MGTNYYWCINHCNSCGRNDRYHIGKRSGGWRFLLRGYPRGIEDHDTLAALTAAPVMSWEDWKKVVVRAPEDRSDPLFKVPWSHIEDEYGEVISPDEFEKIVEESRSEKHNHTPYVMDRKADGWYDSKLDLIDSDGWSISVREFS